MTASAMAAILKELHEDPLEPLDRKTIRQARDMIMQEEMTPYGPILHAIDMDLKNGGTTTMLIADPFAMLWSVTNKCAGFTALLRRTLRRSPSTHDAPWRLILYSDEVVPGNQLSFHNLRKVWVLYHSFDEF